MDGVTARALWHVIEPLHAVTYFAPECVEANRAVGLRGFWMGYFGARAAPLGAVPAAVVTATFFNFHPAMVERAIPDAWSFAEQEEILAARAGAAAAALRRLLPDADGLARGVVPRLASAVRASDVAGRPLAAANRSLPTPQDPVAALWQHATTLREHRGDGHVACLVAEGLSGVEAHVLAAAATGTPAAVFRDNRGWSPEDWAAAEASLARRGLSGPGGLTDDGARLRAAIEDRTDVLAVKPFAALHADELGHLTEALGAAARAVAAAGDIPFPNPMGLPAPS